MWESIVQLIIAANMWDSWDWTNWTYLIFISLSCLVGLQQSDLLIMSELGWDKAVIVTIFTELGLLGLGGARAGSCWNIWVQ